MKNQFPIKMHLCPYFVNIFVQVGLIISDCFKQICRNRATHKQYTLSISGSKLVHSAEAVILCTCPARVTVTTLIGTDTRCPFRTAVLTISSAHRHLNQQRGNELLDGEKYKLSNSIGIYSKGKDIYSLCKTETISSSSFYMCFISLKGQYCHDQRGMESQC